MAPDVLDGVRERKGWGVVVTGAAKGGRRESVQRECGPPMACEPTRAPLVRYFGIKAKQPLLDVTHESASAHPGVLDSNNAPARWGTEELRNELHGDARDLRISSASFVRDA